MFAYHNKSRINLVVGILSILFGLIGLIYGANLGSKIIISLFFTFFGGYEIGKYEEMRHNESRKKPPNLYPTD